MLFRSYICAHNHLIQKLMKFIQSSIFRAICAIITGCLLIKYPDNTVVWITMAIGILFFLSGVISCISYLNSRRNTDEYIITDAAGNIINRKPMFPIVGLQIFLRLSKEMICYDTHFPLVQPKNCNMPQTIP